MVYIKYFTSNNENKLFPGRTEYFSNLETAMIKASVNERGEAWENTFMVFDDGKKVYESNLICEYYINIYDYC